MAESATPNYPVPKPRVSRPHTSTPSHSTPSESPDAASDPASMGGDPSPDPQQSDPSCIDPPSYSSLLLSPSPTQHIDSDRDNSDTDTQVILRPKRPKPSPTLADDEEDDDYENIDAVLDQENRESARRSDYINFVCLDPDSDPSGGAGAARLSHDRYAPSIKLDRHPALKKSQSNAEISTSATDLLEALRKRPRNRAPPPPPGTKSKVQAQVDTPPMSGSGHKRSRSDLSGHSPEPPHRPRPPGGPSRPPPGRPVGRLSPGQRRGVAPRPPNQHSSELTRPEVKGQASPKDTNVRPKRQAPPPPAAKRVSTPPGMRRVGGAEYASVNKQRVRGDQSDPAVWRQSSSSGDSVGPPKPARTRRSRSIENLAKHSEETTSSLPKPVPVTNHSYILESMDLFTLELKKEREVSYGLVIVSGKVRDSGGEGILEGVFVQKVVPDSPADNDGRIRPGDMLVEVGGRGMVGGALDDTTQLLKDARESIRLKIARPNVSSSVFTVEGDDEQPIYENEVLPPSELLLRLHQAEDHLTEVEEERDRAQAELLAVREQAERDKVDLNSQIEELRRQLEEGRLENDAKTSELTQVLASVTVSKTKVETELESLRTEVTELREKLKAADTSSEMDSLRQHNTQLQTELDRERERAADLQLQLTTAESAREHEAMEVAKLRKKIAAQDEQISSLKLDLEQLRNTRTTPIYTGHHGNADPAPLDQTYIKDVTNGIHHHDDDIVEDSSDNDDAFDERVPSPVTPSPYLDFVPLEEGDRKGRKKESSKPDTSEVTSSDKTPVDNGVDQTTTENDGGVEEETSTEPADTGADATAEFDAMVTSTAPLNSSAALHKSQVGKKLPRKKPSQQFLRTMGSSFDLLDPQEEETMPTNADDHTAQNLASNEAPPTPPPDKPPPPRASPGAELPPQPKPRPRPRPRQAVLHDEKKPPVTPRHKEPEVGVSSREGSPHPHTAQEVKKPMVPSPMASPGHKPQDTPPVNGHAHHSSPQSKKKEPILPSPKHLPKIPPSTPSKEHKPVEGGGSDPAHPKPLPRSQPSVEELSHNEREPVIVVESAKETTPLKDESADKVTPGDKLSSDGHTPSSPVKVKHPPPVPKKPRHEEGHHSDREGSPQRTHSFGNEIEVSPRHKKRLPAGAVNIMGFLPVQPRLRPDEPEERRDRSLTVSTSEPGAREKNSLKRQIEKHEDSPLVVPPVCPAADEGDDGEGVADGKKVPPKRPPPPKKATEQVDGVNSSDEIDSDASPMLAAKVDHSTGVVYGEVLSWTPEIVGVWLEKVGLGRHKLVFQERGIYGYMLFDLDGHSLKGMGMNSHDDRGMFKKEIKVLKPYADKQKKAQEKLKKEEKKNAKKKKK